MICLGAARKVINKPGRVKNSARQLCSLLYRRIRAGFEPRSTARHALKSPADQASRLEGVVEIPHAGNCLRPARINSFAKQRRGRAQFFALPVLLITFSV
jgi:hypothetical protein